MEALILERKVNDMNEKEIIDLEEESGDKATAWVQDNLRVIVSVFIVAAIALGIYSYSGRNANTDTDTDTLGSGSSTEDGTTLGNGTGNAMQKDGVTPLKTTPAEISKETATSFIESAERGNGTTHLARRALQNYLEKNPDSTLSKEHKIYIEDYLRKNVSHTGGVKVGTSIEFSKALIDQAISHSKTLNERELEHLKRYSMRAPSLK
jgi:hypothetical protein